MGQEVSLLAQEIGTGYVTIQPSTKGLSKGIAEGIDEGVDTGTKSGGSKFLGAIAKWTARAGLAGLAVAAAFTIKGGISRLLAIDDAEGKLRGLGFTAEEISGVMGNALAAVKGTAFGLGDAATAAASATAAGIKPGKELERYLRLIGDAATIGGSSFNEMGSIINKVTTQGKAGMENLNQLSERGIPIMQWLAKEYGVTGAELSKMVSAGKVDAETFRKVIEENIGGAALESGNTFRGAMSNLFASLGRIGANVLSGLFSRLQGGFGALTTALGPIEDRAKGLGVGLASGIDVAVSAISRLVVGVREFAASATGQRIVAEVMETVRVVAENLVDTFNALWPAVQNLWSALSPTVVTLLGAAFLGINIAVRTFADLIGNYLAPALATAIDALTSLVGWIQDNETAALIIAGVITTFLLPAFVAWGTVAIAAGIKNVIAWATAGAGAAAWSAYIVASLALTWAGWIRSAATAVASAAMHVASWIAMGARAVATGAMYVAAFAFMGAAAVKNAAIQLASSARVIAANAAISAGLIAQKVAIIATTVATKAWAAAQWLLNVAMTANPLGLIIAGLIAFGAAIYLAWTKSETFRNIVTAAWEAVKAGAMTLWSYIQTAMNAIGNVISVAVNVVKGYIGMWVAAFQLVVDAAMWVWNGIKGAFDLVVSGISTYVGLVQGYIGLWVGAFQGFISFIGGLPGAVSGAIGSAVEAVKALPGKIKDAVSDAKTWLVDTGTQVLEGLASGIRDKASDIVKSAIDFVSDKIPGWAKKALGINSPSRVMRDQVGKWIPLGMAEGIHAGLPAVQRAMADLNGQVTMSNPGPLGLDVNGPGGAFGAGVAASGVTQNNYFTGQLTEEQVAEMAYRRLQYEMSS